jgi:putative ABC transport system permease protein
MTFLLETLRLGLANLLLHKLRSLLTALGIIFGVAAVITMVAIGEGNKQKALADIRQLGVQNIIVRSVKPPAPASVTEENQRMVSYGLLRRDLRRIEQTVAPVEQLVPLKQVGAQVYQGIHTAPAAVYGTTPALREVASLRVARGRYLTPSDLDAVDNVAVIGSEVAERLFPLADPLEGIISVDEQKFRVVGVLAPVGLAGGAGSALVGRDLNFDVHIPLTTADARFGDLRVRRESGTFEATKVEISELLVRVPDEKMVVKVADQVERVLEAEHAEQQDVTVVVPLELLLQSERTMLMFNVLLTAIAAISLLVGGIGIMNIMLASVTERTREIGIRRALGATRKHIVSQFLVETTVLSAIGGVIGILAALGLVLVLVLLHETVNGVEKPQVTTWSVVVSFCVATGVGIIFGLYPAIQASRQDPIVALRHE